MSQSKTVCFLSKLERNLKITVSYKDQNLIWKLQNYVQT